MAVTWAVTPLPVTACCFAPYSLLLMTYNYLYVAMRIPLQHPAVERRSGREWCAVWCRELCVSSLCGAYPALDIILHRRRVPGKASFRFSITTHTSERHKFTPKCTSNTIKPYDATTRCTSCVRILSFRGRRDAPCGSCRLTPRV